MNYIVFDIETTEGVGPGEITDLNISVVSLYDSRDKQIRSFVESEFGKMWKHFEGTDAIVGYNSNHFDIPILNKYYSGDLSSIKSIDILESIRESYGRRVKLDHIAQATLGVQKTSNGLQAVEWWKEGKIDEIIKYCEADVKITTDVFHYAKENKVLKVNDYRGKLVTIPINTGNWFDAGDSNMTFSMGF